MQSTNRLLAHKDSYQSIASSRYSSVHSSVSQIRNFNDKFKHSEEKIRKLKERLSQLYHMKSEVSEKQLKPNNNNG
jgi:cell shape-determining protein MreC